MPSIYQRKPDGVFYDPQQQRLMEHRGYSKRIYWTKDMLDYLRHHFATTLNEELAGCIGVSKRTLIRKARELGLRKDTEWLTDVWNEHRKVARVVSKQMGHPGGFKKGEHANPSGEFKKGHQLTTEQAERQRNGMRRWYHQHPMESKVKAAKAWDTRRERCFNTDIRGAADAGEALEINNTLVPAPPPTL